MTEIKKIGLLGCSLFSPYSIILPAQKNNFVITAVASRNPANSEALADKYNIPNVYKTYNEVIESEHVDAVYISLPTYLHARYIILAIEQGKAVLVEKPLCASLSDLQLIQDAMLKYNGTLLEGVMMQHHPWQAALKQLIQKEEYGKIKSLHTTINYPTRNLKPDNYRCLPEKGGGVFFDVSVYWLQYIQYLIGFNNMEYSGYSDFSGPNKTDWQFNAALIYYDGCKATFDCAFDAPYKVEHNLVTEHAEIKIKSFDRATIGSFKIKIEIKNKLTQKEETLQFEPQNYFDNQLRFFRTLLHGSYKNSLFTTSAERTTLMINIMESASKNKPIEDDAL